MSHFALRLLGPLEITSGKGKLSLPTRKLWAIIAYLASQNEPVERGKLAGLLWEEADEERARANLRQELYRLRGTPAEALLLVKPETLALVEHTSDLLEAQRHFRSGDYSRALALFRAEFAAGLAVRGAPAFEDWLLLEREHWQGKWAEAARKQARELEGSQPSQAKALYERILEADPFQEDIQRALIGLTAQLEGAAPALQRYERYKALLSKEFSLEPLLETTQLVEQIRRGQTLAPQPIQAISSIPKALSQPPLVGRELEWAAMEAAWQAGKAIYLSGPPGVGKTRLMLEFASTKGPFLHLEGRPSDSGIPYAYTTRAIRQSLALLPGLVFTNWVQQEISRLLPELTQESPPPITSEDGKLRLLEALTEWIRLIARGGVGAIVADDLQFVTDASSIEVAAYSMARVLPERVMHSITAFRGEELNPLILQSIHGQVEQGTAVLIELQPLELGSLQKLVQQLSGSEARLFSKRLYQATGGNPLFTLETLRSLFAAGELRLEEGIWATPYDDETENYSELPIPPSVREAVNRRVDRLGGAVRRFLEAASLAGESFALEELAGATALSEWEELEAIETAARARLIQPTAEGYGFSHDLVRRALLDGLGLERRKLLHRKLAEGLERSGAAPARIAGHLEEAGKLRQAISWRLRAGEAASRVYANREALEQYQKALQDGAQGQEAFEIHAARAELYQTLDEREDWQAELAAMSELASALQDPVQEARIAVALAELDNRSGRFSQAMERLEPLLQDASLPASLLAQAFFGRGQALLTLGRTDEAQAQLQKALNFEPSPLSELAGNAHLVLSDQAVQLNDLEAGLYHARQALQAFESTLNRRGKGMALRNLGRAIGIGGDSPLAIQTLKEALRESTAAGDVVSQRHILLNLFKFEFESGALEVALGHLERGRELFYERPDPLQEGIFLNNLSVIHRMRGEFGQALSTLSEALALAERTGIAQGRARRRMSLVEYYLDLGQPQGALPILEEARQLIHTAKLDELRAWLEAQYARQALDSGQPSTATQRLEHLSTTPDPHDRARAAWIRGLAWLALNTPERALEQLESLEVPPNPAFQARALAVRLEALQKLAQDTAPAIHEAEALLAAGTIPLMEALELYRAMGIAARPAKARAYRQTATSLVSRIAASLEAFPEFQKSFLERYK